MVKQCTLKSSFSLEGKGLHTGVNVCISFKPAPENYGYKIKRTDVEDQPLIDAVAENVSGTDRGTVLSANGVSVGTVEHALAALYACEIDNCLIEIDGPEFPILDGSAILYVSKIKEIGVQQQNWARVYVNLPRKKIKVADKKSGASMLLLPEDKFSIQTSILFDSCLLKQQSASLEDLSDFTKEIASARTFVFVKEIAPLLQRNLIKGGDIDNAIVIYDTPMSQDEYDQLADVMNVKRRNAKNIGYIMNKPLLYANEPARHKLLDIIGDLALVGGFIKGRVVAVCPGHGINNLFARAIREAHIAEVKRKSKKLKASDIEFESALVMDSHFYWNCP